MEAIRNIQTVIDGEIHLHLPRQFWGQEVEIIVMPAPRPGSQTPTARKSLRGCLKRRTKPELIHQEQDA